MPPFPLRRDDPFYHRLKLFLLRNYPPLHPQQDSTKPISDPATFHHKHIASNLVLKSIKVVPSLPLLLKQTYDEAVAKFVRDGHKFDRDSYTSRGRDVPDDMHFSFSVAGAHVNSIGLECLQIATKVCIHPHAREWAKLFSFTYDIPYLIREPFLTEGRIRPAFQNLHTTQIVPQTIHDILDKATIERLNHYPDFLRCLGAYSFYALTPPGVALLKRMASMSEFHWKGTPNTTSITEPPPAAPPDSTDGVPSLVRNREPPPKKHPTKAKAAKEAARKRNLVQVPSRRGESKRYRPLPEDFIQRAWATAVSQDATFLIFNCGLYERIGFRHRETQTLYLSELIETSRPTPTYGKIHLGLHVAMIQDALSRYESKRQFHEHATATRKRRTLHSDDDDTPPSKRQKTDKSELPFRLANEDATYSVSATEEAFARRNVVLLRLDYRHFFSPAPSAFTRQGASCVRGLFDPDFVPDIRKSGRYTLQECVTITIGPPLAQGAVGVVHRGDIEVETDSGILHGSCLVKMVYEAEQREKLRKEFEIYQHLARSELFEGIIRVHGIFEDPETHTMMLIMDHGGRSLKYREIEMDEHFHDVRVTVPEEELGAFALALLQIHEAGVIHNDIRLENLMISDNNEVAIIDFDCAEVCSNGILLQRETATLEDVLVVDDS